MIRMGLVALLLTGTLCGCRFGPEDTTGRCAEMASKFLDPAWSPRTVTATPQPEGSMKVQLTIAAQGRSVSVACPQGMTMGGRIFTGQVTVQGRIADPGQLYRVDQDKWLTEDERLARVKLLLTPKPGEFSGQGWRSSGDGCFQISSSLDLGERILSTCQTAQGRRYWMSQDRMEADLAGPPSDAPPLPSDRS